MTGPRYSWRKVRPLLNWCDVTSPIVYLLEDCEADALAFSRAIRSLSPDLQIVIWRQAQPALAALRSEAFPTGTLIIDLNLPGMNGLEFLRVLRSNPSWETLPAFILTGCTDSDRAEITLREGATAHLIKPVKQQSLIELLERCLELTA